MMKKGKRIASAICAFGCAAALCVSLAACSGGDGATDASSDSIELNIVRNTNNTTSVFTLDPAVEYQGGASVDLGVCETLFDMNEDESDVEGVLATGYTVSDDGLTWTIDIREGVTFSNGRALDAQVVKESFEYELASVKRLSTMLDIASIEADGQTLTITTNSVVPILPRILTSTNLLVFDTNETADLSKSIIGTGAFVLESVDGDGNCDMVRNDNYWRGTPVASAIHSKCGLDSTAIASALQSGEIDWGSVQSTDVSLFEGDSSYNEFTSMSNGRVYYLYLNSNYTFTGDSAVRQAIMRAIDRESIVEGLYAGAGTAAYSIFPDYSPYYDDSHDQPAFDVAEAKSILADAGYADTDGDGIVEKDGEPVKLELVCYSANQFPKLSETLQAELKDIGIDCDITVSDAIVDDLGTGEFNIGVYAYNTLTYGDATNYLDAVYRTGATSNFNNYSDAEVDAMLEQLRSTTDEETRVELVSKIQERILADDTHVFIMRPVTYTFVNSNITTTEDVFGTSKSVGQHLWAIGKTE